MKPFVKNMLMIKNIILLIRPHQWVKNAFCFLPLFFDRHVLDMEFIIPCLFAFFAYSFAASGIYCFNDIYDVEADRKHPKKKNRPIASGAISKALGYFIMAICWIISFVILAFGDFSVGGNLHSLYAIVSFYILLNIAYCIRLKQKAIVDVFIISIGFVLRVLLGGFATGIWVSHWLILMTFLLALFLAFAKRRDDVVIFEETGVKARKNVDRYNIAFMNLALGVVASVTMVCYILYTVSPEVISRFGSDYIYITSFFVLAGIIRYLQIAIVDVKSGSPTKVLLKDRFLQVVIAGWIVCFGIILYL